jgi:hypothetical protein
MAYPISSSQWWGTRSRLGPMQGFGSFGSFGAAGSDSLFVNESIGVGERLTSSDGRFYLTVQSDGNVVLYTWQNRAIWATNTAGKGTTKLTLQGDGNLVAYAGGRAVWASGTVNSHATRLTVQSDANLVLYNAAGGVAGFATNTTSANSTPQNADRVAAAAAQVAAQQAAAAQAAAIAQAAAAEAAAEAAHAAPATTYPEMLGVGDTIGTAQGENDLLVSHDGRVGGILLPDGNFVIYRTDLDPGPGTDPHRWSDSLPAGTGIWQTGSGKPNRFTHYYMMMQSDGNLVIYGNSGGNVGGSPVWASNMMGSGGKWTILQNDGNLVTYKSRPVWSYKQAMQNTWWFTGESVSDNVWSSKHGDGSFSMSALLGSLAVFFPVIGVPLLLASGNVSGAVKAVTIDATIAADVVTGQWGSAANVIANQVVPAATQIANVGEPVISGNVNVGPVPIIPSATSVTDQVTSPPAGSSIPYTPLPPPSIASGLSTGDLLLYGGVGLIAIFLLTRK